MANLQAVGFDGATIIYLLADGTGTNNDPFVSKFALTDGTITAIGNLIPETLNIDADVTIENLEQPLTLAELEGLTVKVEEQNPVFPGFNLPLYDKIELSYTDENVTTVVYKNNNVTVATLNLGYTDNVLTSVERA